MQRILRRSLIAAVLAVAVVVAIPASAFALLEDLPVTESTTNPNVGSDATWRWNWGNTWFPDMKVTTVPTDGTVDDRLQTLGLVYEFRQISTGLESTVVPTWESSSLSSRPDGSLITGRFDIQRANEAFGWTAHTGAAKRGEGLYAVTFRFYNQFRLGDEASTNARYRGLDLTNPRALSNLSASTAGLRVAGGKWTEVRRRNLSWNPLHSDGRAYDLLSGVGGFKVAVGGADTFFVHNTAPTPPYEPYAAVLNKNAPSISPIHHVTVEDLPGGKSTISVTVVDRATNKSAPARVDAYVDYDTPTVAILAPASGGRVGVAPTLSVRAADAAGISKISYYVDNVLVGVSRVAPFSVKVNLSAFRNGAHQIRVVAEDQIGFASGSWKVPHTASRRAYFTLDKTPLYVTKFSRTPSIFYPIRHDGFYDTSKLKFRLSKAASVSLSIKTSKGKTIRTIKMNGKSGYNKMSWDGKWSSDKKAHKGTYTYQLTATDSVGNKKSSIKLKTTIRNYQLVRKSGSRFKVVPR